jgi:hypothetical protein
MAFLIHFLQMNDQTSHGRVVEKLQELPDDYLRRHENKQSVKGLFLVPEFYCPVPAPEVEQQRAQVFLKLPPWSAHRV